MKRFSCRLLQNERSFQECSAEGFPFKDDPDARACVRKAFARVWGRETCSFCSRNHRLAVPVVGIEVGPLPFRLVSSSW